MQTPQSPISTTGKPRPSGTACSRARGLSLLVAIAMGWAIPGCRGGPTEPADNHSAELQAETPTPEPVAAPAPQRSQSLADACQSKIDLAMKRPALPGAPEFEKQRVAMLAGAKAEPVLFIKAPEFDQSAKVSKMVRSFQQRLTQTKYPWDVLSKLRDRFATAPADGRASLLRDGYLYAENPELAYALTSLITPRHLFGHKRIWVQRGSRTFVAERDRFANYIHVDGPYKGERLRLLHLDRLSFEPPSTPALHRDLRSLMYALHFSKLDVLRITDDQIVATLHYGQLQIPTLLKSRDVQVQLECEVVGPEQAKTLDDYRGLAERQARAVQGLRHSMLAMIDEGLPFDEPRHEYGHQYDGRLRRNWRWAYYNQEPTYNFNGDEYHTFDASGRPLVPQVCVDFLADTLERSAGTWFLPKGQSPKKLVGRLDLSQFDKEKLRRAPGFVKFAEEHPEWFEVAHTTPTQRANIRLGRRDRLFSYLQEHSAEYQPGDIVMIRGKTPWDRVKMHYHSFFIYEKDPISGVPIALAGNAGKPSIRAWEIEIRRTPKRSIWHRIRPKLSWLETLMDPQDSAPLQPLSLAGMDTTG